MASFVETGTGRLIVKCLICPSIRIYIYTHNEKQLKAGLAGSFIYVVLLISFLLLLLLGRVLNVVFFGVVLHTSSSGCRLAYINIRVAIDATRFCPSASRKSAQLESQHDLEAFFLCCIVNINALARVCLYVYYIYLWKCSSTRKCYIYIQFKMRNFIYCIYIYKYATFKAKCNKLVIKFMYSVYALVIIYIIISYFFVLYYSHRCHV